MTRFKIQAAGVIILSLLAQLIGLARISVVAAAFGTSTQYDAFNLVTSLATFVFGFISSGVTVLLIPAFMQARNRKVLDSVQTALYGIIVIGALVLWAARSPLLRAISFGRAEALSTAIQLTSLVVLGQALVAVVGITTAYFQCQDRFTITKTFNLISVVVLLLLVLIDRHLTIERYALYLALTNGLNVVIQLLWGIRIGYRFRPCFAWRDAEVRTRLRMFAPIVVSTGVYQATIIIDTVISSSLGTGRVALLSYMTSIYGIMNAVVSSNLVSMIYPRMSAQMVEDIDAARAALTRSGLVLASVVAGFVAVFFAAGRNAVEALFQHGEFVQQDTIKVFIGSAILLAVLPLDVVRDTIYRFFYGASLTTAPLVNSLTASGLNVLLSVILAHFFDVYGVVLGTSIATVFSLTMIHRRLGRSFGRFHSQEIAVPREVLKLGVAIVASIAVGAGVNALVRFAAWEGLFLAGFASAAVFLAALILTRSFVSQSLLRGVRTRIH